MPPVQGAQRQWLIALLLLVFVSAIGLVHARHLNRVEFVALQQLHQQRDDMNIEWGRLQLEQSTFATHSKIEQVARHRLNMIQPAPGNVRMVKP